MLVRAASALYLFSTKPGGLKRVAKRNRVWCFGDTDEPQTSGTIASLKDLAAMPVPRAHALTPMVVLHRSKIPKAWSRLPPLSQKKMICCIYPRKLLVQLLLLISFKPYFTELSKGQPAAAARCARSRRTNLRLPRRLSNLRASAPSSRARPPRRPVRSPLVRSR